MNRGSDLERSLRGAKVTAAGHLFSWVNTIYPRLMKKSPCNTQQMNQKNAAAFFPCESGVLLLPCDCFLHLRRICGSANKLFMAAYCCSAPTFWLLTHSELSPSPLSLFKLKAPFFIPPSDSAHLFFSLSFSRLDLTFVPPAKRRLPSLHPARQRATSKTLLFSISVCLSLSLPWFASSPPSPTLPRLWTQCSCVRLEKGEEVEGLAREGLGWVRVGWGGGVTSHNHQSERY